LEENLPLLLVSSVVVKVAFFTDLHRSRDCCCKCKPIKSENSRLSEDEIEQHIAEAEDEEEEDSALEVPAVVVAPV
jgi:hypothetical protein